jgi:hypothetical protein
MTPPKPAPEPGAAGEAANETTAPQLLLTCRVLRNRTKIGKAICAAGKRIHLTTDEAKALEAAGLITIEGI